MAAMGPEITQFKDLSSRNAAGSVTNDQVSAHLRDSLREVPLLKQDML